MQFTFKWDQTILCLDNCFIFRKFFDDATEAVSSTHHKNFFPTLGKSKFGFFGPPIPVLKQNKNPYVINDKVAFNILTWPLDYRLSVSADFKSFHQLKITNYYYLNWFQRNINIKLLRMCKCDRETYSLSASIDMKCLNFRYRKT